MSWCVTVVVVSNDSVFLTAFAMASLTGRLLVWSTRLLIVSQLDLQELSGLHRILSMSNAILLVPGTTRRSLRYVQLLALHATGPRISVACHLSEPQHMILGTGREVTFSDTQLVMVVLTLAMSINFK